MTSSDELITEQSDTVTPEELADYQKWQAPHVVAVTDIGNKQKTFLTIDDIDELQKTAQKEGHQIGFEEGKTQGYQAGLQLGQQEMAQQVVYLKQIMTTLNTPLEELDSQIENDLVSLVTTVARQLVRRELKTDREHVIGAVRAALAVLPINDRKLKIFLHPQDVELVKKGLAIDDEESRWQWIEDPMLTRGGCRLETADTVIDASVESRLESVINKLLGGERAEDSENGL
jgi:flagellar assembly protein FliH